MEGVIRKIVIGESPKDGMAYYIGMRAGESKVSAIVFDESHLVRYNFERYLVYIKHEDGSQVLWKAVCNMPCLIEFDCNF